jgi:activator of 2-hydroxyglutaryl-CoA dehydratase
MCAVFADSEIVSLLAAGESRQAISGGVIAAIASRTAAIAAKINLEAPVLLTGGLSSLESLRLALQARLNVPVETSPLSRFAGAIGAALSNS